MKINSVVCAYTEGTVTQSGIVAYKCSTHIEGMAL